MLWFQLFAKNLIEINYIMNCNTKQIYLCKDGIDKHKFTSLKKIKGEFFFDIKFKMDELTNLYLNYSKDKIN